MLLLILLIQRHLENARFFKKDILTAYFNDPWKSYHGKEFVDVKTNN